MEDNFTPYQRADLLLRYLRQELNEQELVELQAWLTAHPSQQEFVDRLQTEGGMEENYTFLSGVAQPEAWEELRMQLAAGEAGSRETGKGARSVGQGLFGRTVIWKVAAAVAVMTLGIWLYYTLSINGRHSDQGQEPGSAQFANDIAPGKNTATLTLADGKTIKLDTNRTSVVVTDSIKMTTMLTASTPRGGTYQVVLADGTKVWLNADSKISFPSQFFGKQRKILLEGEAYFEVAKNKEKPFIVESRGQQVEVLGTHFNVNSYADEAAVKTTLLEGSVRVASAPRHAGLDPVSRNRKTTIQGLNSQSGILKQVQDDGKGGETVTLKPGQQARLKDGALKVKEVDAQSSIDWKEGDFVFENEDFEAAMRRVARWYDVEVIYQNEKPINLEPRGWVSRSSNISSVLKMIESTGDVHFKIEGRRIIVTN